MKKVLVIFIITLFCGYNGYAATCSTKSCTGGSSTTYKLPGCSNTVKVCYEDRDSGGAIQAYTCRACSDGYQSTTLTQDIFGTCTYTLTRCQEICNGCTSCVSDSAWTALGAGYESRVVRTCDCNTCKASTTYRCAKNYYGKTVNGRTGCTLCPQSGQSVAGTNDTISQCFVTSGENEKGVFDYTRACYYQ